MKTNVYTVLSKTRADASNSALHTKAYVMFQNSVKQAKSALRQFGR